MRRRPGSVVIPSPRDDRDHTEAYVGIPALSRYRMRPRVAFAIRSNLSLVAVLVCAAPNLRAQHAVLRGVVLDSARQAIPEATVAVVEAHQATRTDARGRFALGNLPVGRVELNVRRLGYEPRTIRVTLGQTGDSLTVVLVELPEVMSAVAVSGAERHRRQGIEDFYFRRARGIGTFFTYDEILAQRASTPSDLIRTTPGVRLVRVASGKGVRFSTITSLRRGDCMPDLFLDGQRAAGMEMDDVPLIDIEAIELYSGISTLPAQFAPGNRAPCGAIVIWTRQPGT